MGDEIDCDVTVSDCERISSELGDLLGPRRKMISSKLLAAIQWVHGWLKPGLVIEGEATESPLRDEAVDAMYNLDDWHDDDT